MSNLNCISAMATIRGGNLYPNIYGIVYFEEVTAGTLVTAKIWGLPPYQPGTSTSQPIGPFGFHIHEYGICEITNPNDPFASAGGHYNPTNQPHGSVYSLEKLIDGRTLVTKHIVNDKDGKS